MLSFMRKKAGSFIIKIILLAIVVVFVFWGIGSYNEKTKGKVAEINGEVITIEEYQKAYKRIIQRARQLYGNNIDDNILQNDKLKSQALKSIINSKLLLQQAKKLKICVSDKELAYSIKNIDAFKKDNIFNASLYKKILRNNHLTPEKFEFDMRNDLLVQKIQSFVLNSIKVSDEEAKEWYKWKNVSVNIEFALFKPDQFKNIKISDKNIISYFDIHKEEYKTEPKIKLQYLYFDPDKYINKAVVTDDEVYDYYESNPEEFITQKTVDARHILIKVDKDAAPELVDKKKIQILDILKKIKEGDDFAELAKQYSEGPSKTNGGYIGKFKKEDMIKPFADKAFSMRAGEISEPVRTAFGWHIIKVDKVNEKSTKSLKNAKEKIVKKLKGKKSRDLAYDNAERIQDILIDGDSLADSVQNQKGCEIHTTDFITKKTSDKSLVNNKDIFDQAFNLQTMEPSDIIDNENGYYVIQVLEKTEPVTPELKDVKEKVMEDAIKKKQVEIAEKTASNFIADLKKGTSFEDVYKKFKITPVRTDFFKRSHKIPNIGYDLNISKSLFSLTNKNQFTQKVIKGKQGFYVMRLLNRKDPDFKEFDKEKTKTRLLQQKEYSFFEAWLSHLTNSSEISIQKNLF